MEKKKMIILGSVLLVVLGISFVLRKDDVPSTRVYLDENENNSIAVYIKQEDGTYTESTDIPQEGYVLNSEKSTCSNGATPGWDTTNHRFYTDNLTKSGTSCYLYFDIPTASQKALMRLNLTAKETSPDYTQAATTDEGVYKISDGMYGGYSYVWRGAVKNNWVKFANMYWRIVRINGDGSIRMIYTGDSSLSNVTVDANGITATGTGTQIQASKYNSSDDRGEYVGYTYIEGIQRPSSTAEGTASTIKGIVDNWYNTNIGNNTTLSSKVADGKFCNDRNMASGSTWSSTGSQVNYAGYGRLVLKKIPTLSCANSEDIYKLKVGLITADEASIAGGVYGPENKNYYFYTGQDYWTITPSYFSSSAPASALVVCMGGLLNIYELTHTFGVRPVINLKADTQFKAGGNGTKEAPYIVEGAE